MHNQIAFWRPRLQHLASQYGNGDGAHDISHLERVWTTAQHLLTSHPGADALVVMAACYLHDLINPPKDSPNRAQASSLSAQEAQSQLTKLDFPKEQLAAVAHAIEAHSFSAGIPAKTIEAMIVQDADRIDALGAIGLARMFHIGGQLGRVLAHGIDPLATQRPLDDKAYALDHIETKLRHLPSSMKTEAGRKLAETRLGFLMQFRDQFISEWQVETGEAS